MIHSCRTTVLLIGPGLKGGCWPKPGSGPSHRPSRGPSGVQAMLRHRASDHGVVFRGPAWRKPASAGRPRRKDHPGGDQARARRKSRSGGSILRRWPGRAPPRRRGWPTDRPGPARSRVAAGSIVAPSLGRDQPVEPGPSAPQRLEVLVGVAGLPCRRQGDGGAAASASRSAPRPPPASEVRAPAGSPSPASASASSPSGEVGPTGRSPGASIWPSGRAVATIEGEHGPAPIARGGRATEVEAGGRRRHRGRGRRRPRGRGERHPPRGGRRTPEASSSSQSTKTGRSPVADAAISYSPASSGRAIVEDGPAGPRGRGSPTPKGPSPRSSGRRRRGGSPGGSRRPPPPGTGTSPSRLAGDRCGHLDPPERQGLRELAEVLAPRPGRQRPPSARRLLTPAPRLWRSAIG